MNRTEAFNALRDATVEVLQVQPDKVTEEATFEDLEADSLDLVELVMSLEDSLDVKIEEDDLGDVKTVGDAVNLILQAGAAA